LLQKKAFGWYLYPEHIGMMKLTLSAAIDSFIKYSRFIFIEFGRIALSISALISITFLIYKNKFQDSKPQIIYLILVFCIVYLAILSINFSTIRYVLSVLPLYIIVCVHLIYMASKNNKWIFVSLFSLLFIISGYFTLNIRNSGDHTLGYIEAVKVQKQAVEYLEQNNCYDKKITANFLMRMNLTNPDCGYLSSNKNFVNITDKYSRSSQYIIISSLEPDQEVIDSLSKNNNLKVRSFELNNTWVIIYKLN
jgi:hypothetical protein